MTDSISVLEKKLHSDLSALKSAPAHLVFDAATEPPINAIAATVMMRGLAVVHNFIPHSHAVMTGERLAKALKPDLDIVSQSQTTETDRFFVNIELQKFKSFPDMAQCAKPVFNMRNKATSDADDAGLIDLFKPDMLYPDILTQPCEMMRSGLPRAVLNAFTSIQFRASSSNLYINHGITRTRGFHIDADLNQVKAFVYLTDVTNLDDGPYCYIPGSHQETQIKNINRVYNTLTGRRSTDMMLADPAGAVACLGPAGTLILSLQNGLHRGYPQKPDRQRLMLVELFDPA